MGSQVGNTCFINKRDALDFYFSSALPSISNTSGTVFQSEYSFVSGVWRIVTTKVATNGSVTIQSNVPARLPNFPFCDSSESLLDGMTVGWGLSLIVLTVYAISMIKRAI